MRRMPDDRRLSNLVRGDRTLVPGMSATVQIHRDR